MYQSACSAATTGSCAEPERNDRDGLIPQPAVQPVEHDYSGFDIVKATQYGAIGRVKELIEAGWDVNQPDSETVTLLHWASINNRKDIIKYFLERGAIVDAIGGEVNEILLLNFKTFLFSFQLGRRDSSHLSFIDLLRLSPSI